MRVPSWHHCSREPHPSVTGLSRIKPNGALYTAAYVGLNGAAVHTTPIAITVGRVPAVMTVWNQQHAVTGGRTAACDPAKGARSPYVPGCEAIFSDWLPAAKVTYTLSYADCTTQTFTGTTGSTGHLQHVFAVGYQPSLHATKGEDPSTAWISVVAISNDGTQATSACLRFTVVRKS